MDLTTAGAQPSPAHLARNPQGLVPVLEIDGLSLTQSLAGVEFLDETRAAGFLPQGAPGRTRVRALAYAVAVEMHPVCNLRIARHAVDASRARSPWKIGCVFIGPGLVAFEAMLDHPTTGRFCHGDVPGLADICLMPQLYNADRWGISLDTLPRIRAVRAELACRRGGAPRPSCRRGPTVSREDGGTLTGTRPCRP